MSTAEYLKLWKVVNLVAFFFLSTAVSFDTPTFRQKRLLRRPPTSSPSEHNSDPELKRSFVKKVSTIYSPFFPRVSRTEIRFDLSPVAKWIINDLYEAS